MAVVVDETCVTRAPTKERSVVSQDAASWDSRSRWVKLERL